MQISLTFNEFLFSPVTHQGNLWIRAVELARALGYSDERSVGKIYQRNADEFTPDMTQVIEISEGVNLTTSIRIFSLRGCHLLAMFARTPVAKAFRRWVLDVIEQYGEQVPVPAPTPLPELPSADAPLTPDQQCTLQAIVRAKVEALPLAQQSKGTYPKVWSRFNNHFRIARYSQLSQARMSEAVTYLTRMEVLPPAQEQLALPATSAVLDERVQKVQSLVNDVKQRGSEFTSSVLALESALRFRPATMDTLVPAFGRTLERNLPTLSMAINMNVRALCDLLDVYCSTLTGPTENVSSPAPAQPCLPSTGDPYEAANGRLEEMRRKYHALRDEAGSLLVQVMMDDERRMPPQLLVKMPTPITDMTESFFRNSIDLHQSWSSNPILLIRELHQALGLKRTVPLKAE